ncbi:MAG: biotin--[acetyl-CoA-carboxylase] ligase [Deltaproteobacteria bacterium]|nr:biotin--[acetyl-CoA-carboxylase] ligase [Deltaproteobacteria bacterium]MBI4373712.1 biotin--[acetyl-CoA-carboxylase] ligase [Deltaproteobacteria bacterium]
MLIDKTSGSCRIYRFGEIDSTNSEAIRHAREGEPAGSVYVSDSQTGGRGREGRRWESPPGKNLYVSFLLRPEMRPVEAMEITQGVAVVVRETLKADWPSPAEIIAIKPPNDIMIGGKKVAGILCEMSSIGEKTSWVVVGIGINVNTDPEDFSPEVRETATSLKTVFGREFDREEILERLIQGVYGKNIGDRHR